MIKLSELLKELQIDELELRAGELEVDDNKTYYTFLEDFRLDPDDEEFEDLDAPFNPRLLKKSTIAEDGPYQFIVPSTYTGTLYLVNSEGKTIKEYVIGTVDVDIINLSAKDGKPFKITGAEIHLTYVTGPWRGKGFGQKMYTMLLGAYGSVFSDNILYEGSLSMWTKKMAPLGNQPGNFFGIQTSNIIIPLTNEDAADGALIKDVGVDHFIVSINPPQVLSDIKEKLSSMSLSKGDYGVFEPSMKTSVAQMTPIVDEAVSLDEIIDELDLYQVIGKRKDNEYSNIVVALQNAMVILREGDDEVTMDII
jgi:hypothetical protein